MVAKIVLTQGCIARELIAAADAISGEPTGFEAVCLDWDDSLETGRHMFQQAISRLERGEEILVLTDLYGGTPYNIAAEFRDPEHLEIVTGVNLPMLVRLGCCSKDMPVAELARWIQQKGRGSICLAGETVISNDSSKCSLPDCEGD